MMIMKKKYFDEYCEWLFDILFELEKRLDISGYSDYDARVFGFVSERLLDVTKDYRGRKIEVSGQFRSYNRHEGVKNKLVTTKSSIPNAAIRKIPLPAYFSDSCFSPAPR